MASLKILGVGDAEDVVCVAYALAQAELDLRRVVHYADDGVKVDINTRIVAYALRQILRLVIVAVKAALRMQGYGDNRIYIFEKVGFAKLHGHHTTKALAKVVVVVVLEVVDSLPPLAPLHIPQ